MHITFGVSMCWARLRSNLLALPRSSAGVQRIRRQIQADVVAVAPLEAFKGMSIRSLFCARAAEGALHVRRSYDPVRVKIVFLTKTNDSSTNRRIWSWLRPFLPSRRADR